MGHRVKGGWGCNFRVAWESLHEKMHLSQDLEEEREKPGGYLGRMFHAERMERAKIQEARSCLA